MNDCICIFNKNDTAEPRKVIDKLPSTSTFHDRQHHVSHHMGIDNKTPQACKYNTLHYLRETILKAVQCLKISLIFTLKELYTVKNIQNRNTEYIKQMKTSWKTTIST